MGEHTTEARGVESSILSVSIIEVSTVECEEIARIFHKLILKDMKNFRVIFEQNN